jgi:hypothetical protein
MFPPLSLFHGDGPEGSKEDTPAPAHGVAKGQNLSSFSEPLDKVQFFFGKPPHHAHTSHMDRCWLDSPIRVKFYSIPRAKDLAGTPFNQNGLPVKTRAMFIGQFPTQSQPNFHPFSFYRWESKNYLSRSNLQFF